MSRSVWKYPVPLQDYFSLTMPEGAQVLHVDVQGDDPCLWAHVDTEAEPVSYLFRLAGTGHPIESFLNLRHVGSFLLREGTPVCHLFQIMNGARA